MKMIFSFLSLLLFFLNPLLFSQTHQWHRTNPGGGGAYSTIGAGITGTVVAGSDLSGAYISHDHGKSWEVLGASGGLTATHVSGVGFDRFNGDILYIGADDGIFRSDDGGRSARQVLEGGYITDIEFSPVDKRIGYATYHPMYNSNQGSIYKTTDRGLSWHPVSKDLPAGLRILKLVVHPTDVNTLYLQSGEGRFACGPAEVFRSTNGGGNWKMLSGALGPVLDINLSTVAPYKLYVTTMHAACGEPYYWTDVLGGLYVSDDAGNSWDSLSDYTGVIWLGESANTIRLIDPREPWEWNDRAGTYLSTDGGRHFSLSGDIEDWDTFFQGSLFWSYGSSYNGICKTLGKDLSDGNSIYWVNSQWCFHSTDGGQTFDNVFTSEVKPGFWASRGFDNVNMMDIEVNEANPDLVYVGYFDIGLWRSTDHGESWQACNQMEFTGSWEGYGGNCATIVSDPQRPNVVWASLGAEQNGQPDTYLIRSDKSGERGSWKRSDNGLPNEEIMGLSLDRHSPKNKRTLYVTAMRNVYKSIDDGVTWTMVLNNAGCRFTAVDGKDNQLVYAGGEKGIWRSEDGGQHWTEVGLPLMHSTNNGGFWAWGYDGVWDVKVDPNVSGRLYVAVHGEGKGLFRSDDRGTTWNAILMDDYLRNVAILPSNSQVLYATSSSAFEAGGYDPESHGVLYSTDGGAHWSQQNGAMAYPFAQPIAFDSRIPTTVFVGSPGTGIQKALVPYTTAITAANSSDSEVYLYPNPTKDIIHLFSRYEMVDIEVKDINGRIIKTFFGMENSMSFSVTSWPSGLYYVTLKWKSGSNRGTSHIPFLKR